MANVLTMGALELKLVDGHVRTEDGREVSAWLEDRKGSSPYWWPSARGAGARGAGEGTKVYAGENPFAPGAGFNLTRQGEILRSDPEMAKVMQQAGEGHH